MLICKTSSQKHRRRETHIPISAKWSFYTAADFSLIGVLLFVCSNECTPIYMFAFLLSVWTVAT